jgi:hypothetical protein
METKGRGGRRNYAKYTQSIFQIPLNLLESISPNGHPPPPLTEDHMLDLLMLLLAAAFFAVSLAYVFACNRL